MSARVHLDHGHILHLLSQMLRIRFFEEKCAELYQAEKIRGFLHLAVGEAQGGAGPPAARLPPGGAALRLDRPSPG